MNAPKYKNKPVEKIDELARILGVEQDVLVDISQSASHYYRSNKPRIKPDGTTRQTYRVLQPLQDIQEEIKDSIFCDVEYPIYLQGGIKDFQNPRDYVRNVLLHVGKKIVIKEDIANFFPSIKVIHVFKVWKGFFGFSEEVSNMLTKLTTYKGFVPQGAKTSSYLANLVFWEKEPELENIMGIKGLTYSRLIDDITISADYNLTKSDLYEITKTIYQMIFSSGFRPKRQKRKVMTSGSRINIHNLNTNSGSPTLSQLERKRIRSAVNHCEISANLGLDRETYEKMFANVRGRVALLERLHPQQAKKYVERLELIKPDKIYKDLGS